MKIFFLLLTFIMPAIVLSNEKNTTSLGNIYTKTTNLKRPYQCLKCKKNYKRNSHVMSHYRFQHSSSQPLFSCIECSQSFARPDILKRHSTTLHSSNNYNSFSCPYCNKKFKRNDNLTAHQKSYRCLKNKISFLKRIAAARAVPIQTSNTIQDTNTPEPCTSVETFNTNEANIASQLLNLPGLSPLGLALFVQTTLEINENATS